MEHLLKSPDKRSDWIRTRERLAANYGPDIVVCVEASVATDLINNRLPQIDNPVAFLTNAVHQAAKDRPPAPTRDQVCSFFRSKNRKQYADPFFDFYESKGWVDEGGKPILCWQGLAAQAIVTNDRDRR